MYRARAFFYVAAGVFLLALSYHIGARNAGAQSGVLIEAPSVQNSSQDNSCVVGRTFYWRFGLSIPDPVPGSLRIIASASGPPNLMLENGDVYEYAGPPPSWLLRGNVLGAATPATRESFGAPKSRYRATPGEGQRGQGH